MANRMRLSLRWFLLTIALLCALFGIFASRAQSQRRAVARIEALGGSVEYSYVLPKHFESILGPHFVAHVSTVRFFQSSAINELPNLAHVTDVEGAVTALHAFPRLKAIHIRTLNHGRWVRRLKEAFPNVDVLVHYGGVI